MTFKAQSSQTPLINFIRQNSKLSRRAILNHIISGDVLINKKICNDSSKLVLDTDVITLKNNRIYKEPLFYYKFNKPLNVISTLDDPKGRKDLQFYLNKFKLPTTLKPIGRLDRQSSGLLLFSNDGDFIQRVLHPKFSISKQYEIKIDKPLQPTDKQKLITGFFLNDGPVKIQVDDQINAHHLIVSIDIGRNRILRRALEFFGYTITVLHRLNVGPIKLGNLKSGLFEQLQNDDIKTLVLQSRS
jgi:23S rRNA pseudouridine2605 synthase